jgi:hypothetical protein
LGRQLIGWLAAYALVLHAILAGAAGVQIAANAAPGFELCLSHPDGTSAPAQGQHEHDQCALHCAAFVGFAALAVALIAALIFPLWPVAYARRRSFQRASSFLCRAGQSRAPPLTT